MISFLSRKILVHVYKHYHVVRETGNVSSLVFFLHRSETESVSSTSLLAVSLLGQTARMAIAPEESGGSPWQGWVLELPEAKGTVVARRLLLLLLLIKAPEVMDAAICAGSRSPSPWQELVRKES